MIKRRPRRAGGWNMVFGAIVLTAILALAVGGVALFFGFL